MTFVYNKYIFCYYLTGIIVNVKTRFSLLGNDFSTEYDFKSDPWLKKGHRN